MKEIYREIKEHLKKDFNLYAYLYVLLFTFISLFIYYIFKSGRGFIYKNFGSTRGIIDLIIFYLFTYFAVIIPILIIKKKTFVLKSKEFWVKTLSLILVFGFFSGFYKLDSFAIKIGDNQYEQYYLAYIFAYLKMIFPVTLVMIALKIKYDKKDKHFYGLRKQGLNYKPYFLFLLILLPLVISASFMPDFLSYYPRFKFWIFPEMFGLKSFMQTVFFKLSYAVSFVSTEFFFRGAFVIGLARILDKDSVLAMASFYCFSHFGKPVGEAISAFFGGYILGVIALNHKNINGGIIVHIGLAFLMEAVAMAQYLIRN
ncbi:MAG: CPBP family intramembrane metalloprotease [Bacteroidales bacterium]|nr:CPBP family intramembrane metalloprotease [Bacteroidales bacterium]